MQLGIQKDIFVAVIVHMEVVGIAVVVEVVEVDVEVVAVLVVLA